MKFLDVNFGEPITVVPSIDDLHQEITEQLKEMQERGRASIVFLKDDKEVRKYTDSKYYKELGGSKSILNKMLNATERDHIINKAASRNQITVAPAVFGWGTDFKC